MTFPARVSPAATYPPAPPADARPLFRSDLLTVRETAAPERCATRHQLAFARPPAAPPRLRLDDGPPRDPTRVLLVPAGETPASRRALAGAATWTVLGFARDAVPNGAWWPAARGEATVAPCVLFRFHALCAALGGNARAVEDGALALLAEVRARALTGAGPDARDAASRRRRTIAEGARVILARAPGRAHPLADVARALDISPSHLAHVFRAEAGMPLHRWLLHLRLAVALERLADGNAHLSALALDLGFATHSHFSAAFRRWCGVTPAAARATLAAGAPPTPFTSHRAAS